MKTSRLYRDILLCSDELSGEIICALDAGTPKGNEPRHPNAIRKAILAQAEWHRDMARNMMAATNLFALTRGQLKKVAKDEDPNSTRATIIRHILRIQNRPPVGQAAG